MTAAAIAFAAVVMFSRMPPHRIVMATGPEGSAYYEDGKRYRAALAKAGVEVQLLPTVGSVETAALLHDLVPKAIRVAVLVNPANTPTTEATLRDIPDAAGALGLQIQILNASASREIEAAFATLSLIHI